MSYSTRRSRWWLDFFLVLPIFGSKMVPIKNSRYAYGVCNWNARLWLVSLSTKSDHKTWCQLIGFPVRRHQQSLTQVGSKICRFLAKATTTMNQYVLDHSAVNSPTLPTRLEYSQFNTISASSSTCILDLPSTSIPGSTTAASNSTRQFHSLI